MISLATVWLSLCLALCVYAWLAVNRTVLSMPVFAVLAAYAVFVPTGTPRYTAPPPGEYQIVGAKIDIGKAIYVLLDDGKQATYYRLPYSDKKAGELQGAMDAASGGGTARAKITGEHGGETYDGEPPVHGEQDKRAETPELGVM